MVTGFVDNVYNFAGIFGYVKEEDSASETRVIDPITNFYRKYNSVVRFPIFVAGAGLVGKFGVELFNHLANGEPIDPNSPHYLQYGLGLISLSSSMYIKEINPKLLDKVPLLKQAYHHIKEKLSANPIPVTVGNYSLEDKL